MNEQLIIKMAMPFVRNGYLTLEQFDVIYHMLSKKEQYQVIDILNRHDIEIIDENEELESINCSSDFKLTWDREKTNGKNHFPRR